MTKTRSDDTRIDALGCRSPYVGNLTYPRWLVQTTEFSRLGASHLSTSVRDYQGRSAAWHGRPSSVKYRQVPFLVMWLGGSQQHPEWYLARPGPQTAPSNRQPRALYIR